MNDDTVNVNTFLQFHGPLDISKKHYREFRVKTDNLASSSNSECTSIDFANNVKRVIDQNDQTIGDLKKQIREIEKTNYAWNQIRKLSDHNAQYLIHRILQSDEKTIKQFEVHNFKNPDLWTKSKKTENPEDLKLVLSTIKTIDENGVVVEDNQNAVTSYKKDKPSEIENRETTEVSHVIESSSVDSETVVDQNEEKAGINKDNSNSNEDKNDECTQVQHISENVTEKKSSVDVSPEMKEKTNLASVPNAVNYIDDLNKKIAEIEKQQIEEAKSSNASFKNSKKPAPMSELMSNEEKEERRKLATVAQIAALKGFIDAGTNTASFTKKRILEMMADNAEYTQQLIANGIEDEDAPFRTAKPNATGILKVENDIDNPEKLTNVDTEEDESEDDIPEDVDKCSAYSEKEYATSISSTTAESETSFRDDILKSLSAVKNNPTAAVASRKKRAKKGKKQGKKNKNGIKMTIEEIEAIKKRKKLETDRAFEQRQKEERDRLERLDTSQRHKKFRDVAQIALKIRETDDLTMPIEITQLSGDLDYFANNSDDFERISLRGTYFQDRVSELKRVLIGPTLDNKLKSIDVFKRHIDQGQRLFKFFMFLSILDEAADEYYEFELMMVQHFHEKPEKLCSPHPESTQLELDFYFFRLDVLGNIPETDQFVFAAKLVRDKLILFEEMSSEMELTDSEKVLRETYLEIGHFLKEYRHVTLVTSFLQKHKDNGAFNLMEEWFLVSERPRAYHEVKDYL